MEITGIELRRLREGAGLFQEDVAGLLGCGLRSVKRWEAGNSRVPAHVVEMLQEINTFVKDYAAAIFAQFKENAGNVEPDLSQEVVLLVYEEADKDFIKWDRLPFNSHSAVIFEAYKIFKEHGIPVRMLKFKRQSYLEFLNGKKDDQASRSEWSTMQLKKDKAP